MDYYTPGTAPTDGQQVVSDATVPRDFVQPSTLFPVILPQPFLTVSDLYTHIYEETVNAITNNDTSKLQEAIDAATQEAMGYMSRFDFYTILSQQGTNRDPVLMLYMKDIAKWHFIVIANPNLDYECAENRYKSAVRWLEKVQDGRFIPVGWPLATISQLNTEFHVISRNKRCNNY